jgi:glycosyltransferase involved in cell wall biosynthesis
MTPISPHEIGVVAIGRNEGMRLIDCLTSVRSVTANIVYVDSGSTDGSVAAAEKIGASVVKLDLTQPFTAARARNEGFATLNTLRPNIRFVQFIDGDCSLAQLWIDKALAFMEQRSDVAIVCGRRRERDPAASIYNRLLDDEWNTPVGEATACGGDALVRVETFVGVGGFRPSLIAGEEPELCVRLREDGWKIWRLNEEMTQHDAAMRRFAQWWVRSVRSGYGFAEVSRLHQASPHVTWGREIARAVFWAGALPLVIVAGALIHPFALWLTIAYPLHVVRLGIRRGATSSESWRYAILSIPAKFAQLQGILKFYWRNWRQQATQLIEYKKL